MTMPHVDTEIDAITYFNNHVRYMFEHAAPKSVQQVIDFANAACDGVWRLEAVSETRQIW